MKFFVAIALVVISMTNAEPPRFRGSFARQTVNPQAEDAPGASSDPAAGAPYAPSGWKPQGAAFTLPARQPQSFALFARQQLPAQGVPDSTQPEQQYYGAPPQPATQQQYGPPPQQYGPPQPESTTTEEVPTTTDLSTTTEEAEQTTDSSNQQQQGQDQQGATSDGRSGKLQESVPLTTNNNGPQIFFVLPQQQQQQQPYLQQLQQLQQQQQFVQLDGRGLYALQEPTGQLIALQQQQQPRQGGLVRAAKLQAVPLGVGNLGQFYPDYSFVQFV